MLLHQVCVSKEQCHANILLGTVHIFVLCVAEELSGICDIAEVHTSNHCIAHFHPLHLMCNLLLVQFWLAEEQSA